LYQLYKDHEEKLAPIAYALKDHIYR